MATAATAKKEEEEAPTAERKVAPIDPSHVYQRETIGRHFFIRLPEGAQLSDLNEARDLFRWIQGDPNRALARLDRVEITDWDESWWVDALVSEADSRTATLVILTKKDLPSRNVNLPSTDEHVIKWSGVGYSVHRLRDGQRVSHPTPNLALATLDLRNQYSRRG